MSDLSAGMLVEIRRFGPDGHLLQPNSSLRASAVDVRCRCTESGGFDGLATGSHWVMLDAASYVRGKLPPVKKATTSASKLLGVVVWGQGTIANGQECWVRVVGEHPYALVDGTADLAAGDYLQAYSTAGQAAKAAAGAEARGAFMLEAYTDNSAAPKRVLLNDPATILAGRA